MRKRVWIFVMAMMTSLDTLVQAENRPVMKPVSYLAVDQRKFSFSCLNARTSPQHDVYAFVGKNGVDLPESEKMGDDIFQPIGGCKGPFKGDCTTYYPDYTVAFVGTTLKMTINKVNKTRDMGMYVCKSYDLYLGVMSISKEFTPLGLFREPSVFDSNDNIHDYCLGEHCYRAYIEDTPEEWSMASEICGKHGMDLPEILEQDQQKFLSAIINAYPINSMWLGFRRYDKNTAWLGVNPNFSLAELPDHQEEVQNCLDFVKTDDIYTNDWVWKPTDCEEEKNYMCQYTAKPVRLEDEMLDVRICDQESIELIDQKCYLFVPEKKTWRDAQQFCKDQKGMSLLTVEDEMQDKALANMLVRTTNAWGWFPEYWLDMKRDENDIWKLKGGRMNYTHWFKDAPKLLPMEKEVCGVFTFSPSFLEIGITGRKCKGTTLGFICKLEACGACHFRNEEEEDSGCRQNCVSFLSLALVFIYQVI